MAAAATKPERIQSCSLMSENVLFLCLDSVRYDTYLAAETPNMDAIDLPCLAHSFSCWTIPSIIGYLMSVPPIDYGGGSLIPNSAKWEWTPDYLTKRAYSTIWLSTNGLIAKLDLVTKGFFGKHWKHFINPVGEQRAPFLIAELEKIAKEDPQQPHFVFMLLMETHHPYQWAGGSRELLKNDPQGNFDGQVKAIEYIDSLFPQIIKPLTDMNRPTRVIITSDHGELFGPHFLSHDPSSTQYPINFDPKLFEIPFVEGIVTK